MLNATNRCDMDNIALQHELSTVKATMRRLLREEMEFLNSRVMAVDKPHVMQDAIERTVMRMSTALAKLD